MKPGRWLRACAVAAVAFGAGGAACPPSNAGQNARSINDAYINVSPAGGTDTSFNFEKDKSEIQITPPANKVFTATFTNHDPAFTFSIRVDGTRIQEGDTLRFPLTGTVTNQDAKVTAEFETHTYASDTSGSQGTLTFTILNVTDDVVDLRATFNLTLHAEASNVATVQGFLEAHYGDALFQPDTNSDAGGM